MNTTELDQQCVSLQGAWKDGRRRTEVDNQPGWMLYVHSDCFNKWKFNWKEFYADGSMQKRKCFYSSAQNILLWRVFFHNNFHIIDFSHSVKLAIAYSFCHITLWWMETLVLSQYFIPCFSQFPSNVSFFNCYKKHTKHKQTNKPSLVLSLLLAWSPASPNGFHPQRGISYCEASLG